MKKLLRVCTLCLALLMAMTLLPVQAAAAENSAQQTETMKAELESKYGISIKYPTVDGEPAVGPATLDNLDRSLSYVGTSFMRQLSEFQRQQLGYRLTFSYVYPPLNPEEDETVLGRYIPSQATIELYIPRPGSSAVVSGNAPLTILHEVGHAFHFFYLYQYEQGERAFHRQWTGYNGGVPYGLYRSYDGTRFISAYAATDYYEDFAETFAHAFSCNRAGFSIAPYLTKGGGPTGLGNKVALIEKMIPAYMSNVETAVATLRQCYSTPTHTTFGNLVLSSSNMQYINFNAPLGVLSGMLRSAKIDAQSTKWEPSIGGWWVTDVSNLNYIMFPGGTVVVMRRS